MISNSGISAISAWRRSSSSSRTSRHGLTLPPSVKKPTATIKRPIAADTKWAALTPEKIEQIKQMARDGKTVKEIVDATCVSDPTVRKYKREVDNEKAEPYTEGPAED